MRQIKFRGISIDSSKMVYGCVVNNLWVKSELTDSPGKQVCEIIRKTDNYYDSWDDLAGADMIVEVRPETVGQFTGLTDKNGKDIYEGDVVNYSVKNKFCTNSNCDSDEKLGIDDFCPRCGTRATYKDFLTRAEVVYEKGGFAYLNTVNNQHTISWHCYAAENFIAWVEVIGNIYEDNKK